VTFPNSQAGKKTKGEFEEKKKRQECKNQMKLEQNFVLVKLRVQ
jgi:hypothetical protein